MQIVDSITLDQVEAGDQILIDGDPIEVDFAFNSPTNDDEVVVFGFSHNSGDTVQYSLPFDYPVDIWGV